MNMADDLNYIILMRKSNNTKQYRSIIYWLLYAKNGVRMVPHGLTQKNNLKESRFFQNKLALLCRFVLKNAWLLGTTLAQKMNQNNSFVLSCFVDKCETGGTIMQKHLNNAKLEFR